MIRENTVENMHVSPAFANEMLAEAIVHFGATKYNPELVQPIKNENWAKPKGGLWTSPVNSEWGWKHWCEAESFRDCNEENSFKLLLNHLSYQ